MNTYCIHANIEQGLVPIPVPELAKGDTCSSTQVGMWTRELRNHVQAKNVGNLWLEELAVLEA